MVTVIAIIIIIIVVIIIIIIIIIIIELNKFLGAFDIKFFENI